MIDYDQGTPAEKWALALIRKKYPKAYQHEGNWKGWDICIPELNDQKIEVKDQIIKSAEKGNVVIEYEDRHGEASGIDATTADKWMIFYTTPKGKQVYVLLDVRVVRFLCADCEQKPGGNYGKFWMYVLPIAKIRFYLYERLNDKEYSAASLTHPKKMLE